MKLTEIEKQKLIDNIKQIITYIEKNIQPYVRDEITIGFGGSYMGIRSTYTTTLWHLMVEPKKIYYAHKYGLWHNFAVEDSGDYSEDNYFKVANNTEAMVGFVTHWAELKSLMHQSIAEQKKITDAINDFKI